MQEINSALGVTFNELYTTHKDLFSKILRTIWRALQEYPLLRRDVRVLPKSYYAHLYRTIQGCMVPGLQYYACELADVRQQLLLIWFLVYTRGTNNKTIKKELMRFSLFRMRNWIRSQVTVPRAVHSEHSKNVGHFNGPLNLKFLLFGDDGLPHLSKRDRYEIYLHYTNEKTINEMVSIVRYRKQNIIDNLRANMEYIRSFYDYT